MTKTKRMDDRTMCEKRLEVIRLVLEIAHDHPERLDKLNDEIKAIVEKDEGAVAS